MGSRDVQRRAPSQTSRMKWCSRNTKNIDSVVFRNQMSATANVNIS